MPLDIKCSHNNCTRYIKSKSKWGLCWLCEVWAENVIRGLSKKDCNRCQHLDRGGRKSEIAQW